MTEKRVVHILVMQAMMLLKLLPAPPPLLLDVLMSISMDLVQFLC